MAAPVLTWRELVELAGSRDRARRLVRDGVYRRVLRGVYAARDLPDTPALRSLALRRVVPAHVVLCGRSALWIAGVDCLPRDGRLDVLVPRGLRLARRRGLAVHSALALDEELVELPGGLVSVSAARAVVDVARNEGLVEAVAVGDAALRSGAARLPAISASLERAAGLRGVIQARAVVGHLESRSESPGESRLRMALVLGGLPQPEAQVDLYDEAGVHLGRIDLVLQGVALEYDGREQRLRRDVFDHDRSRQNALVATGIELRRYTGRNVREWARPALCADVLRAVALAAGRPAPTVLRGPDTLRPPRLSPLPTRAELGSAA